MGIPCERLKIADAIVARTDFEECPENKRTECRVSAGTSAGNRDACRVCLLVLNDEPGSIGAVLNVHGAPGSVKPITVSAAITSASAVINIQDRVAATSPILS